MTRNPIGTDGPVNPQPRSVYREALSAAQVLRELRASMKRRKMEAPPTPYEYTEPRYKRPVPEPADAPKPAGGQRKKKVTDPVSCIRCQRPMKVANPAQPVCALCRVGLAPEDMPLCPDCGKHRVAHPLSARCDPCKAEHEARKAARRKTLHPARKRRCQDCPTLVQPPRKRCLPCAKIENQRYSRQKREKARTERKEAA